MNVSEIFIRKPIATSLLMLGIAVFGVVAYHALPVSDLPTVDFPTINVGASLPGANPATMASAVATPLERQFTGIAGLDSMTSVSSMGSTSITLQFDLNRDIDGAAVDVQTAISEATPLLPPGMPSPPSFHKSNPSDMPILMLGLTGPNVPLWVLDEYAERMMAQRISMVDGVAQVQVMGSQKYAVRVQVDPDKLASRKIGLNEVDQAIQNWNVNLPTGTLFGAKQSFNVQASGQLMNAAAFQPMVVAWRNGVPVRLEQIAHVMDSVEDDKNASWIFNRSGGERAINLMIMRQPGSNTVEVTREVTRLMPFFQSQLPPGVSMVIRSNRAKNIADAFKDVQFTLFLTLGLVIMVIFLFLRNLSATAIPTMALPFSILGTFTVMYVLDYSLDNLSMMAIILSVGFVVDDAIVMLENIVRHIERGEQPMVAALRGSREISFTIVSMTLSLAAVFIPIVFMGGILGRLFREFAITICTAILISGLVSVTLTPMLCSRFLRFEHGKKHGAFHRVTEAFFNGMLRGYDWSLTRVLRHRYVMGIVFVGVLASTVVLFNKVPKGFIPDQDMDQMYVNVDAIQGTSYYQMVDYMKTVANILRQDPNVDSFMSSVGGGFGSSGSNNSRMYVQLKPRKQRKLSAQKIMESLRPKFAGFPGFRVLLNMPQSIRIGGRGSKSSYEFTLQANDTDLLYTQAAKMERELLKLPIIQDVSSDLQIRNPRINVAIDRDKAATMGLTAAQIESTLYSGFGPRWTSTIYAPSNQYRVLLELDPKYQKYEDYLSKIFFKSADGNFVPLGSFAKLSQDAGPQSIAHSGQLPSVTISFNLKPGVSLGEAVDDVQDLANHMLAGRVTTSFTGTAAAFQSSLKNLTFLLFVAIMVVYIVLGVLYESYIHPLTILSGLPSAGFGALLTLMLFGLDLNIYSFVGLIMLVGIVKKNAIMQIDFALEAERKEGKTPAEAIYEGCLIRFRPIMMTTMAALLGALPISLGLGSGGEARRPLGLAVMGGLIFSQLITLYLTPVVYIFMAWLQDSWGKRKVRQVAAPEPVSA
ncbi:MAG: efflux RND transporter permease subunit [Acidobacteriota bacterium]|nr:efflux RND transporter permease subunit [Acidobacteriota bacterium]